MWICKLLGHKMVHVTYPALFGHNVKVYCKRCGNPEDRPPEPTKDTAKEGEQDATAKTD